MGKLTKIDQSRNGVKVVVWKGENGSTVECDCSCFGNSLRVHSNPSCPVLTSKPVTPSDCRK